LTAQYEPGLQAMREGLEIARATGVHTWTFQLLVHGYGTALGAGDLETAAAIAKELAPLAPQAGRLSQVFYHHFQGWEAMLRKDLMRALQMGAGSGRQYGYQHFLWWWPAALSRVCARALEEGIESDYVRTLIRERRLIPEGPVEAWPWMFRIYTLGSFRIERHGEALGGSGKAQRRPLELLKVLIAYGGEKVSESLIVDPLWPR